MKYIYCETNVVVQCKTFCTDIRVIIAVDFMISTTELAIILNIIMLLLLVEKKSDFSNSLNTTKYLKMLI